MGSLKLSVLRQAMYILQLCQLLATILLTVSLESCDYSTQAYENGLCGGPDFIRECPAGAEYEAQGYLTRHNVACTSTCDYRGEDYMWCRWGTNGAWDYCSLDYRFTRYYEECGSTCARNGEDYYWCDKKGGGWDYCSPTCIEEHWGHGYRPKTAQEFGLPFGMILVGHPDDLGPLLISLILLTFGDLC